MTFLVLLFGLISANDSATIQQNLVFLPALGDGVLITKKVDFMLNYFISNKDVTRSIYSSAFLIAGLIGCIFIGAWVETMANQSPPSDVVLTKQSEDAYSRRLMEYQRSLWRLAASVCGALVLAVASNAIYDLIVKDQIQKSLMKTPIFNPQ